MTIKAKDLDDASDEAYEAGLKAGRRQGGRLAAEAILVDAKALWESQPWYLEKQTYFDALEAMIKAKYLNEDG
jgi:hypothetical protein